MKTAWTRCARALAKHLAFLVVLATVARADETKKPDRPKVEGRPVYLAAGRVVVFPEGVEEAPKEYKGSLGTRPLALIRVEDKLVGEVFASPLKGTSSDEATGMADSAKNDDKIELLKRTTIKQDGKNVEVVTLKLDLPSNFGKPWILHSLYFPLGESSTTFKLAVSEAKFSDVLPYLETMLDPELKKSKRD